MGEVWIKEAERLTPVGNHNAMSGVGGPRATLHCTVSNPGSFDAMVRVLRSKSSESHLLYDGKTDRLGQFFPLDRAARALARGTLAYSHNRVGSVNIQIEVCNMPVDWTASSDWRPGPNFRAMLRAIRSHGIRDEFIYRPAKTPADRANVVRPNNLLTSTAGGGKWWGHCHYGQGETHWDPGPINVPRFFSAAPSTTIPEDEVTPQDIKAVVDGVLNARVVPADMLGVEGQLVTIPRALDLVMRWSLEGRDAGLRGEAIAKAQAEKGESLTPAEVEAIGLAVGKQLAAGFEVDITPKASA